MAYLSFQQIPGSMVEFSVVVSLDGKSIEEISQAIYNVLKNDHEVAHIEVADEYE